MTTQQSQLTISTRRVSRETMGEQQHLLLCRNQQTTAREKTFWFRYTILSHFEVVSNQTCADTPQVFRSQPFATANPPVTGASNINSNNDNTTGKVTPSPPPPPLPPETINIDTSDNEQNLNIDELGILTQYIGLRTNRQVTNNTTMESEPKQLIDKELKPFKELCNRNTHPGQSHQSYRFTESSPNQEQDTGKVTNTNKTMGHQQG